MTDSKYKQDNEKKMRKNIFNEGNLVIVYLLNEQFPTGTYNKLLVVSYYPTGTYNKLKDKY